MSIPNASHSTSKAFVKYGKRTIGASVILLFISDFSLFGISRFYFEF
jgi:hypothetical protein